jgi:hypothetical protein
MSQRRMFSPDIVESEEFLTMPVSSQALYFHLAMGADDDGFIQPKITMRVMGANDDDLKVLISKRFILKFETGVVVVKHWLIHNLIRADRYKQTRFKFEKSLLKLKENKSYTEINKLGCQDVNQMAPQVRLGKVRLGKDSNSEQSSEKTKKEKTPIQEIVDYFFELKGWQDSDIKEKKVIYSRYVKPAKDLLDLCNDNVGGAKKRLEIIKNWADSQEIEWGIETVFKRWLDLEKLPQEREKKAFINNSRAYQKGNKWFIIYPNGEHKEFVGDKKDIIFK